MPRILDLYCCQGGASEGYRRAGFDVYGVDIEPQPKYPFPFHQGDALSTLTALIEGQTVWFQMRSLSPHFDDARGLRLSDFDAIHASPPCQAHTLAWKIRKNAHPDLIEPTRRLLQRAELPYVIENVPGSPLRWYIELCGAMFGLETYRHRWFEWGNGWRPTAPEHPEHVARTAKMGRPAGEGEFMHIVGNFSGVARARQIMSMPWANRDGLSEAIPPAYTEFLGRQLMEHLAPESHDSGSADG